MGLGSLSATFKMKSFIVFVMCTVATMAFTAYKSPAITLRDYYDNRKSEISFFKKPVYSRIIGGTQATIGQFPWQVAIYFKINGSDGYYFCGGALISDTWILTAAHCAYGAIEFILNFGGISLNAQQLTVISTTAFVHSGYNAYLNNDVALIRLDNPITFTDTIQPILLPPRCCGCIGANVTVRVSGWGTTADSATSLSTTLNWVDLTTISNSACREIYGSITISSYTLCAVGNPHHSTCSGDSGGALITIDEDGIATHRGVTSFVHVDGCASGNPSGYVRTACMLTWIANITGLNV